MNQKTNAISIDLSNLAEDTQDLITSVVDGAASNVKKAKRQLSDNLDSGKELALAQFYAADDVIRQNPYYAIGICVLGGIGLGIGLGFLIASGTKSIADTLTKVSV